MISEIAVYECLFGKWHELVSKIGWQKISAMTNVSSMLKCEPDRSSGTAKSKGDRIEYCPRCYKIAMIHGHIKLRQSGMRVRPTGRIMSGAA